MTKILTAKPALHINKRALGLISSKWAPQYSALLQTEQCWTSNWFSNPSINIEFKHKLTLLGRRKWEISNTCEDLIMGQTRVAQRSRISVKKPYEIRKVGAPRSDTLKNRRFKVRRVNYRQMSCSEVKEGARSSGRGISALLIVDTPGDNCHWTSASGSWLRGEAGGLMKMMREFLNNMRYFKEFQKEMQQLEERKILSKVTGSLTDKWHGCFWNYKSWYIIFRVHYFTKNILLIFQWYQCYEKVELLYLNENPLTEYKESFAVVIHKPVESKSHIPTYIWFSF